MKVNVKKTKYVIFYLAIDLFFWSNVNYVCDNTLFFILFGISV